jgi:hypothetical protein
VQPSQFYTGICEEKGQLDDSRKRADIERGLERGSWRISTVRICYQGKAEDTAGWKTLGVCASDLYSVEISDGAINKRSNELPV